MSKGIVMVAVLSLAIGVGVGYFAIPAKHGTGIETEVERKPLFYRNPMNPEVTSPVPTKDPMGMDYVPVYADADKPQEKKILFYRNAMNPAVTSPTPAKDAMGMDYVPVYAEEDSGGPPGTVKISPVVQNNIGLRTTVAEKRNISRSIRAVGRVDYDEEKIFRLHPKVEGWVSRVRVDKTGQPVAQGEVLLDIYAPKLVSTQQEYLLALNNYEALKDSPFNDIQQGASALVKSSRARLRLLDVPEGQIKELEKTKIVKETLPITAPADGTVLHIGARQGQFVMPGMELYRIVDLGIVWVYADIYEYELPWVREGDTAEMTLTSLPGTVLKGTVSYIYPYSESKTRTTKVRLIFDNPEQLLRPDMLANITIHAQEMPNSVVVPAEAIVRSGEYDQIFVMKKEGVLEPRRVNLGIESEGVVAVLDGLQGGERVVVSAQFLIDSESKLREATAKMVSPDSTPADTEAGNHVGAHQ